MEGAVDRVIGELTRSEEEGATSPSAGGGAPAIATEALFAALYEELHRMAEFHLRGGTPMLGATTLLHEVYLDLAQRGAGALRFPDRGRFMAYASRAMRSVVIDFARRARAQRRGGGALDMTLSAADRHVPIDERPDAAVLESLSEALDELAGVDAGLAQLVDLHFFCGFTLQEIAAARGVSERTAQRDWRKARLLLHRLLGPDSPGADEGDGSAGDEPTPRA